jgi:predicted DsbA family dithiol-disulfide isomerase
VSDPLEIPYYSDVLCIWAYAGQIRVETLRRQFGERIRVVDRFINVYGDVPRRILEHAGQSKSPRASYAAKLRSVARRFDHIGMREECFTDVVPGSSNQAHLVLAAVRLIDAGCGEGNAVCRLARRVRQAFFEEARDVGRLDVLFELLEEVELPREPVEAALMDGRAMAELSRDFIEKDRQGIVGSPTYVLDGGRQKLFGNVGYRVIEANVTELLERAEHEDRGASWC